MQNKEDMLAKAEAFLKESFQKSIAMHNDPVGCAYRIQHSYRVANIGKTIAEQEGFDPTEMAIACLLHDIAYVQPLDTPDAQRAHGRISAKIVRPFLEELSMEEDRIQEISYGIAIHVDGQADFEGVATAFAETISDADNIDRFDAYRIYETLHYQKFQTLSLEEQRNKVENTLLQLHNFFVMQRWTTPTATAMWKERIQFYIAFYERLRHQLMNSDSIL